MLEKIMGYTVANGECLEWTRCFNSDGYPRMGIKGNSNIKVHRLVFELYYETDPKGMVVRHKCDNPKCINPKHLLLGTPTDNTRDRDERNRHGATKLTHREVNEIRDLVDSKLFTLVWIGNQYGVTSATISSIKRAAHWKHVTKWRI